MEVFTCVLMTFNDFLMGKYMKIIQKKGGFSIATAVIKHGLLENPTMMSPETSMAGSPLGILHLTGRLEIQVPQLT